MKTEAEAQHELLMSLATRTQLLERLLQATLIIALRDAADPQALIERLRMYCIGGPDRLPDLEGPMEAYLATLEAIAHDRPLRR